MCCMLHLQVNDYQIRLRGMTRRMMATVSELSMYQAHSIKLCSDKEALETVVRTASDRLEVKAIPHCIHDVRFWYKCNKSDSE